MRDFRGRLGSGEVIVADGALGTLLMEHGLQPGECPELLNLVRPGLLEEIARLYLEAGAEIIQANTFGASPLKLAAWGLADRAAEINLRAVEAVRGAVGSAGAGAAAWVAGSCGPSGCLLEPYGDTTREEMARSFIAQARALVAAGVDLILVETMTDIVEARVAIEAARTAAREAGVHLPVVATMTFEETPRGFYTIMGTDIPTAARELARAGADAVGSNCGNGSGRMTAIAREFRRATSLPLVIQSNAGLPVVDGDRISYPESPACLEEKAREWIAAGATIIGGCCGTTPAHVRALRAAATSSLRGDAGLS